MMFFFLKMFDNASDVFIARSICRTDTLIWKTSQMSGIDPKALFVLKQLVLRDN